MAIPRAVSRHADYVTAAQTAAVKVASRSWRRVNRAYISESWREILVDVTPAISAVQERVAVSAVEAAPFTLAEQGVYKPPSSFVDTSAFAGLAPDGRSLDGLLYSPAVRSKHLIGQGLSESDAVFAAQLQLGAIVRTLVADTARQAASVDIAARAGVGYMRVVVGETCRDCIVLAGRYYRWNAGFKRHPGCDCKHVPTTQALSGEQITDPYEHFNSLTEAEQNELWGQADAQAIRDGADVYQVYNSRRGRSRDHMTTLESTGRRGQMPGQTRLTPDGIYAQATSREEALRLLEANSYILPGGQVPGGVIRGLEDGFAGALGRGGTRVGATASFREALRTGVRNPLDRATMTAAERRLFDSTLRWQAVLDGRNPYSSSRPLTPEIAARVERDYQRWLRTGGQVFT